MKNILITVLIAIIVGIGAFFAGIKYQQSKQLIPRQFRSGQGWIGSGGALSNRVRTGNGQVIGEIISQDEKSITVKLPDGSSKIVLLSETTAVSKATKGSKTDLKVGEHVGVFGTTNADGSLTAQNIQLNPVFKGMRGTIQPQK